MSFQESERRARNRSEWKGISKREELVDVFRKVNYELLALTETKLKINEEFSWYGVNNIITGVQEIERTREGMVVLLNDV